MSAHLLAVIRAHYSSLTHAERDIADFVLSNSQEVVYMPIPELAYCCSVSQTSVERFCHRVGQPGYKRFRLALAAALEAQSRLTPFAPPESDPVARLMDDALYKYTAALDGTRRMLCADLMEQSAARLAQARHLCLFAQGRALPAAMAAHQVFSGMLRKCGFAQDGYTQHQQAQALTCDDAALFFSLTGTEERLLALAEACKKAAAFTLLVTCGGGSPLSQRCDSTLCCCASQNPSAPSPTDEITALAAFVFVLEALCQTCARS